MGKWKQFDANAFEHPDSIGSCVFLTWFDDQVLFFPLSAHFRHFRGAIRHAHGEPHTCRQLCIFVHNIFIK